MADTEGPLVGIRILEFAGIGPGPYAAMLLADMGAEIIRVDRPTGTDPYSRFVVQRSRRTVTADLKDPADREAVLRLLAGADALIEGFRPGVMERLGLGPEEVLAANPQLIYGRMTGWGQTGPLAQAAGHDLNYIAITGALAAIGPSSHPVPPLNLVGDYGGGALFLVAGLLAALLSARQTGRGQVVDAAICDGAASMMAMFADLTAQGLWRDQRQANMLDGGAPYYRSFACKDGRHISVAALEPQFYAILCRAIGVEAAPDREDKAQWKELHCRFEAIFAERTRNEWCELLEGTDACFAPVLTLAEAPSHPHLASRGTFTELGGIVQPAPAPRFSHTPSRARQAPPERTAVGAAAWTEPPPRPRT